MEKMWLKHKCEDPYLDGIQACLTSWMLCGLNEGILAAHNNSRSAESFTVLQQRNA